MIENTSSVLKSKRHFLKSCFFGACGVTLGIDRFDNISDFFETGAIAAFPEDYPAKWMKEGLFYAKTSDGLKCQKCPNECLLAEGEMGICRNRICKDDKIYSIAYGNPCAVHVDPIEKKPLFHFLPSTKAFSIAVAGCNLRCLNCQNWQISQFSPKETKNVDMQPETVVNECIKNSCQSIAYTYSEPTTFYEYAYDTAKLARERGIKNVWKSNGYINEIPLRKLCKVMDAANIDLKSFDAEIYTKLNSGRLDPVLKTLKVFKEEGVWLEITNLVIPSWTDNLDMIKKMCDWLYKNKLGDCPLHFSRFTPLYKLDQISPTPVSTLNKAREIALNAGIQYPYIGNVPGHSAESTYCHSCKKMLMERRGFTILQNHIVKGKCEFCGVKVPGVWG